MLYRQRFKVILALLAALVFGGPSAFAYRVLIHVGHAFTAKELRHSDGWKEVAARADGVWVPYAWIRTLKSPAEQDTVLSHVKSRAFYLAAFHWSPIFVGDNRKLPNPVIDAGRRNGFHEIWCMTYDESRYGSTLSTTAIQRFREIYPGYKLISNLRVFKSKRFAAELAGLDGLSYEFNVLDYRRLSRHHPEQKKLDNVVEAICWCLDHGKTIFLLLPPGDDRPSEDNRYIEAMKQLLRDLDADLADRYFQSDRLFLVRQPTIA